ncbi:hypothetical protein HYFRA_00005108 [Hymenoscyphus fraxineus]|uniref:Uncharacterized protein n=1 Tax=Hymenoscyphus fraxineus TaxID=746836 RepID=A0A9N9L7X9_9HELO|nr:hypothetical protein HYFRA_00005108 [Hymenoscyphus fraxineus]
MPRGQKSKEVEVPKSQKLKSEEVEVPKSQKLKWSKEAAKEVPKVSRRSDERSGQRSAKKKVQKEAAKKVPKRSIKKHKASLNSYTKVSIPSIQDQPRAPGKEKNVLATTNKMVSKSAPQAPAHQPNGASWGYEAAALPLATAHKAAPQARREPSLSSRTAHRGTR